MIKLEYKVKRFYELERFGFGYDNQHKKYVKRVTCEVSTKGFDDDYHSAYLVVDEVTGKLFARLHYGFSDDYNTFQWIDAWATIPLSDLFELIEAGIIERV